MLELFKSASDFPPERDLQELLSELLRRVAELESRVSEASAHAVEFSQERLLTIASAIYRSRQFRAQYFSSSLFAEPAWDMLLDLFVNRIRGRRVSTTSLCLAANVPQATGLRWIAVLKQEDLVHRSRAPDDRRLMLIDITPRGYQLMKRFVADSVTRFDRMATTE